MNKMISLDEFYDEYLKGKNESEINRIILLLKNKIEKYKEDIEHSNYVNIPIFTRKSENELLSLRAYLDYAKETLSDIGCTYHITNKEKHIASLNDSIPYISKMDYSIGGYLGGYNMRKLEVKEENVFFTEDFAYNSIMQTDKCERYLCKKQVFIDRMRELNIGEWHKKYNDNNIMDGTEWHFFIEFSNGHKPVKFYGSNAYPYNFSRLETLLDIQKKNIFGY